MGDDNKKTGENEKKSIKAEVKELQSKLSEQQLLIKEAKIPVIVLVEGWAASGKGSLINEMISELDPRFYNVASLPIIPEKECRVPTITQYIEKIPENGKFMFYDSGWMENIVRMYIGHQITKKQYKKRIRAVRAMERQLRDAGYVILKLFLNISKETQFERLSMLQEHVDTEWRVTDEDRMQHREYRLYQETYEEFMNETRDPVPWHILDVNKRREKTRDALRLLVDTIDKALKEGKYIGKPFKEEFPLIKMQKLADVNLDVSISEDEYKVELKRLQNRLTELHNIIYRKKIPVIICYEGWDAAGKGGNIRRVTYPLDPRGFDVIPIASPLPHELARHYLWRFWTKIPRTGHIAIFDRTWYGRVMVERLEGLCDENDWKRAYNEINEFETLLTDWGAVVLKFWIHIDSDTQLERFTMRQETPSKQWKITEEDWRNREKWDLYEEAVDEMLEKTSTRNAPWYIIESNDKKYARIRTLKIIVDALEKASEDHMKNILS